MNIIIFGQPGAGKGTQAKKLVKKFNLNHISTGDLLRDAIANKKEVGITAEKYIKSGQLVPDNIIIKIIEDELTLTKGNYNGFLLDGFPRNVNQAILLEEIMQKLNQNINFAINLNASDKVIIERLCGRRICSNCGKIYHIKYNPPKENELCDNCNSKLTQRPDDKEAVIVNRLKVFKEETLPVFEHYANIGIFKSLNADEPEEKVFYNILELLQIN